MRRHWLTCVPGGVLAPAVLLAGGPVVEAQEKQVKIGVVLDHAGSLVGGGSNLQALGAKIKIDYFRAKFFPELDVMAGQDERAFPVIAQYVL